MFGFLKSHILRRRKGGATVEYVFWVPFFIVILAIMVDVSLVLMTRARMFAAASDACRIVALAQGDLQAARATALARFDDEVDAAVTVADGMVTATLTAEISDVVLFGGDLLFRDGLIGDGALGASMSMALDRQALDALSGQDEAAPRNGDANGTDDAADPQPALGG